MRNIHEVNFLVDVDGKVYGADFRVWKSLNLSTLDPVFGHHLFLSGQLGSPLSKAGSMMDRSLGFWIV